jgi:hypothetical protein
MAMLNACSPLALHAEKQHSKCGEKVIFDFSDRDA